MWYLKVSSSLLIAVALICMIQNAISLAIDQKATEDQWSTLASSTDQNDLKKISKLCKASLNNFNEKLENTKTIANKKLPEPNKTTDDIADLVTDIKNQVKNASADLVTVRKLVQKTALRFRDTFKSLVSFTELDSESVNKELESIKKTTVDSKKPLVNRVIRSFGNRYDLNKLANKVLEISSDREKLKNNYDEKKKIAKKEFISLWKSLTNHSKTVNDNALKALDTFFEGMKSVKSVKKKVKTLGEDALNEIKVGDDIIKLKNAVELAKSLKLKFEDEWNLDSGELTYSEEQKKPNTKATDDDQFDVQANEEDESNEKMSTNDIEPGLPKPEQEPIENDKNNIVPPTQAGIEKLPTDNLTTSDKAVSPIEETQLPPERENKDETKIMQPTISETEHNPKDNNVSDTTDSPIEENPSISNTENKGKTVIVPTEVSNKDQNSIDDDDLKSDSSTKGTSFNPDINNNVVLETPLKDSIDNKRGKRINKITSREKTLILPWEKLIQLDNPHVSQQSMKCEKLLNNVTPNFDSIKKAAKNSIQVTKDYKNLQNIENDTVKQFYDKMVDTNTKLCDYLVKAADDVCTKVTPIHKRYETKFKNDPNIKRIKYLLGKQYDPNQYILKVLDDANHKNGIGGMKKTTYYKMLAVAHNLNHETKEMENAALYAMNKIHEGQLAATNLQKKFNKEKASKACYIRNILLEKENENDKRNKDENQEKVKESINEDINTEPLKPDVNLDSVDAIQPSTINDDNEPIINNNEDTNTLNETNELTNLINPNKPEIMEKEKADKFKFEENENSKESMGQGTQEPYSGSSSPQEKDNDNINSIKKNGNNKAKHNITRKITHHRRHRNPNDPNDESEEYDSIEEIDDEEEESNESKNKKTQNEIPKKKDYSNLNKSEEKNSDDAPESGLLDEANNEHDKETPDDLETEKIESNEENVPHAEHDNENTSAKPRVKRRFKIINPRDGRETTEDYETTEEVDDTNLNRSGEKKSDEAPESEVLEEGDNEHARETPDDLETEKIKSNEENAHHEEPDEGSTSAKPRVKRRRKIINPKDGKEMSEEYETTEEEEDSNLNKSGEEKSDVAPESELLDEADKEHDTETPDDLETEKIESNEENAHHEEPDEGNTSAKPRVKRRRKIINPKDGKEMSEEYETTEEEDDSNLNKSGEKKSDEAPESKILEEADNEHARETPDDLETEKIKSNEENAHHEEPDEGNNSPKPRVKRRRKIIDPKDGKEMSEEYETTEEEDDSNLNKSGEKKSDEAPESELLDAADNEHDTETPDDSETEKIESNEENVPHAEHDDENTSAKPRVKHRRKIIDPKDGKEMSEEYETTEEEDDSNLNKSGEEKSDEAPESELLDEADKEHDTETPDDLETEKIESNEENAHHEEPDEGNTSAKPRVKRRRKIINPKDGKEMSEEYETTEEEDDSNLNKSGQKKSDEAPESEILEEANNEHARETPDDLETEKIESNEENAHHEEPDEGNNSPKPRVKRRRKIIDPKDGKEMSEEYETTEEEDDSNLNKSGEEKSDEAPESELLDEADNEHDTETPDDLETEKIESNEENAHHEEPDEGNTSAKPRVKRRRKIINPRDGKEMSEEYETTEEEDDSNLNKSVEEKSDEAPESELLDEADNEHDTETPDDLETEKIESNEENAPNAEHDDENTSAKPRVKRRRKIINPKDGKEMSEEYETTEEEDDSNLNKSGEEKSDEAPESELLDEADKEHDTETPDDLATEKIESNEENAPNAKHDDENTSAKPRVKRRRKIIDPKDGKEMSEEYETTEEEDDSNLNKSGEEKSDEAPESELLDEADKEHDTETPDDLATEKIESNEENTPNAKHDDENTSAKPRVKRRRKIIDPKDGKEMSEEYETTEEEDDSNLNKSGENKSDEAPESELLDEADNEHDTETPDDLETEKIESNDENAHHEEPDEGNTSPKPRVKRRRKIIDPKDGKEMSEEYETTEEEDDSNLNKSGEKKSDEAPESEVLEEADNEHDTETPDDLETEKIESNEENAPNAKHDDENTSAKPRVKRRRKIIDPKDGKEMSEEYETTEEEDDSNLNKSGEKKSDEAPESEVLEEADNEHDTETPDDLETEKIESNEENAPNAKHDDENTSAKPRVKRRRKIIDPKDGKEMSEEYETTEEEDDSNLNKSGEKKSDEAPESEVLEEADNEHDTETPDDLATEKIESNEENTPNAKHDDENTSAKPRVKRRRKIIDPKDGKEMSEEYETTEEEDDSNLNKSGEKKSDEAPESEVLEEADNEHDTETPDDLATEKIESNEENTPNAKHDDENTSAKPRVKRRIKIIDPKDGKEMSEEYETTEEEDDSNLNKSGEKKSDEAPESDLENNDNYSRELKSPQTEDNVADSGLEKITDELDENENLNSVEFAELNGVDNDKIIPAAESMGEDSSSVEASYEEAEQNQLNDTNNSHKNNKKRYDVDYQPNEISESHRKRNVPKNGQEISEEYDTDEDHEDYSPVVSQNIDTAPGKPDKETIAYETETPEYENVPENEEISENDKKQDNNQSNEHEEIDENDPETRTNEAFNKSNDIDQENNGGNQPNKKIRRHRKRKDPIGDQELSEEYDTFEEHEEETPVVGKNIDIPNRRPDGESTDRESETPEYEDIPDNEEIPETDETPDHNQSNEHAEIDENEPETTDHESETPEYEDIPDNEEIPETDETPDHNQSNEHAEIDENEPETTDHESETPEYEDIPDNEEIPETDETPDHNQSNEHAEIDENEPETTDHESETPEYEDIPDNEEIPETDETPDHNQSNEHAEIDENEPETTDHESETPEYEDIPDNEEIPETDETPDHNQSNEHAEIDENEPETTDHESETPEYEDIPDNEEIPETDETPDHNQSNEHAEIDENEPETRSNEAISNSEEIETFEEREDESPLVGKNIDKPTGRPNGESTDPSKFDNEIRKPEYPGVPDNGEIPETGETPEYNQSTTEMEEHEPETRPNEKINKSNDIDQQNYGGNQPYKKVRCHRKRQDTDGDQDESEEYDTFEEQEDESPVVGKNIDKPTERPNGESTDPSKFDNEIRKPEYLGVPDNGEIPETGETPEYNQSTTEMEEHEPETRPNEKINKSNDIDQQNYGGNQPYKKVRCHRKRQDTDGDQDESEEYDTFEEQEDESPVVGKNIDKPTERPNGETTDPSKFDSENRTLEYLGVPDNGEIPKTGETPEYNQSTTEIDKHEPETRSNEAINKSNDIDQQNYGGNQPNKKIRCHRKRKDPLHSHEISEEYETFEDEDDEILKLETPNMVSYDKFDKNPLSSPNNENNSNDEKNLVDPPKHKSKRFRNRKYPEYDHEISEEYDSVEEYDKEAKLKKHSIRPEMNEENRDLNNNVNSNTDNDVSEDVLKTRYNEPTVPQTIYGKKNEAEPEDLEYAEPEASSPNDVDETINVGKPQPRKVRRHRKSRQPKTVNEDYNEPELVKDENMENYPVDDQGINDERIPYDENNVQELPETGNGETTDINNEIEQPELSEYPENSDVAPEASSPNDVDETTNVGKPRPRKVRRHRKSRQPKTVNEDYNEPELVNDENMENYPVEDQGINDERIPYDDNNVQELPETGNGETTDINNEIEQPELSEYPGNSDVVPEASYPNDVDETTNVGKPRPRKVRRHRKSRQPKTVNEDYNEPELVNDENYPEEDQSINDERIPYDDNNVQELPETGNGETTDINNEIEQPELSEYPENLDVAPEASSPNDVDETTNDGKPRPRKVRRHRKSRQPKTVNEDYNEPELVNDENYPVEDQSINDERIPYDDNNVQELPETGNGETTDINNEIEQPELSEYPGNSDVVPEASYPNDVDETTNVGKPRPRKVRRHRKSRQPKTVNEDYNEPELINDENMENYPVEDQGINDERIPYDDNNVQELPETGNGETTDINNEIEQPELSEYPENSDVAPEASSPNDVDKTTNVGKPRPRKVRRHRKSRQPKTVNENYNEPEVVNDRNVTNHPVEDEYVNNVDSSVNDVQKEGKNDLDKSSHIGKKLRKKPRRSKENKIIEDPKRISTQNNEPVNDKKDSGENENPTNLNDIDGTINSKQPRRKKHVRRKKIPTTVDEITPNNLDTENGVIQNDEKSVENLGTQPNDPGRNPKKKRRLRRIRTYMVNKATNERIPINVQTYSTNDGLPDTPKNKLEATEVEDSDDKDSNEDNDDYSSFLFKEYNSDQCKRDAYDRFKKVTSQDAKQIAYRSVLDTSEMRSNMLATIKNAISNVKLSKTLNDVDQSLRTVSYSLKTGLKQTVSDLVTKVIPLAKDFLKTAENLKELYKNGPQSTHKMLSNILENESTVPDSAKDVLKLISPQFDVDELINNIFEKPFNTKSLKEKKAKAQRKLIGLSKHMDTAISNIDCFVLSAMSAVGIGADTLKLLKSGRVIMSDKHPRSKALRDAVGIIKSGKKIRNNDVGFTPTSTPSDGFTESDEDDDDEDPDEVAQKNEEFLKTVPDLDDMPIPKKVPNKRQSLGVIVVHPDKQIEYKEVTDTSQLKKFVGDQTKKYKLQSKNNHPKFLKLNSKKLIDSMVADVKKKAERNGMSKKEMVEEIIKNLKSS